MMTDENAELSMLILACMEEGMSLRKSCESIGVPPGTFMRWVAENEDLTEHYTRAREHLLDMKAEDLEDIGERAANAVTAVEVAGLRLQSDNRKWLLSKLMPKKYGERQTVEHEGKITIGLAARMRARAAQ